MKNVAQQSGEASSEDAGLCVVAAVSFGPLHGIGTHFVLGHVTRAVIANKVMTKRTTVTPILRAEEVFISAEKG